MTSLQFKHIASLQHAIKVFESGLDDEGVAKYHKCIVRELKNLIELRDIVLEIYRNPFFPAVIVEPPAEAPVLNPIGDEPDEAS